MATRTSQGGEVGLGLDSDFSTRSSSYFCNSLISLLVHDPSVAMCVVQGKASNCRAAKGQATASARAWGWWGDANRRLCDLTGQGSCHSALEDHALGLALTSFLISQTSQKCKFLSEIFQDLCVDN